MWCWHIWQQIQTIYRCQQILQKRFPENSRWKTLVSSCIYALVIELGEVGNIIFGISQPKLMLRSLQAVSTGWGFKNLVYGSQERNTLDIYGAQKVNGTNRPVVIFIHGGAWAMGCKLHYGLVGYNLEQYQVLTVVPNYRVFPYGDVEDMMQDLHAVVCSKLIIYASN